MALKAGYTGVKKSLVGFINSISGMKLIKTIGDGLDLTSAGKLNVVLDSETMEFVDNKVSSKSKGLTIIELFSSDTATGTEIVLDDDVSNYKFLLFEAWDNAYKATAFVSCLDIEKGVTNVPGVSFGDQYSWYLIGADGVTLTRTLSSSNLNVRKIYGVK